jgi:integrase
VRGNKKDAEAFLGKIQRDMAVGTYARPTRIALGDFFREWLDTVAKLRVRERTYRDYESLSRRYIEQHLGARRLDQLRTVDIQTFYAKLLEGGLSARSVRYVHAVLHMGLEYAVVSGRLGRNPTAGVSLPRMQRGTPTYWAEGDLTRFLEASNGTRFHALWLLLVTSGIRPGEALALRWADYDGKSISVRGTLTRSARGWKIEDTKTLTSNRRIRLPDVACDALRIHRARQAEAKLLAGPEYAEHDFIFASAKGEPLDWRVTTRRYFRPLLKAAGVPKIRPYDLRHTHASHLVANGVSIRAVAERLGHSSPKMTLDVYSHVLPGMDERVLDVLDRMLEQEAPARPNGSLTV